ncbi:MAG: hypothetical protein HPY65_03625 [Syntrophaceae bacterium]|nr:hypothetical protein [Syntrophaceae bacterium]
MKKGDVPQDDIRHFRTARKAAYAVDEEGHYTTVPTTGWDVEEVILYQAIEEFEEQAEACRQRVALGEDSPIAYFMFKRCMDPTVLAQAMGLPRWRVRRHLKGKVFDRLGEGMLREYARVLRVPPDALKPFRPDVLERETYELPPGLSTDDREAGRTPGPESTARKSSRRSIP